MTATTTTTADVEAGVLATLRAAYDRAVNELASHAYGTPEWRRASLLKGAAWAALVYAQDVTRRAR